MKDNAMEIRTDHADRTREIANLFKATFTASEGAEEGELIGAFVSRIFATTDAQDLFVFSAMDANRVVASAIFTRMRYSHDERTVFILSPMAVSTTRQRRGVGQKLLTFSLTALRKNDVDVALTYGDISFYAKVGFRQIPESVASPPLALTYPEGWLGQSLTSPQLDPLQGVSNCVDALNDPALW